MRIPTVLIAVVVLPLFAFGCASSGPKKEEVDRMSIVESRLSQILAELIELKQQSNSSSQALVELRDEVAREIKDLRSENIKAEVKLDSIEANFSALMERIDDSELRITTLRKDINSLRLSRTGTVFARPPDSDPLSNIDHEETQSGQEFSTSAPASEFDTYQKAYTDYIGGNYSHGVNGFRAYLRNFPEGSRAEEAQFYLAESYYNLGEFIIAVEEYDNLIHNFEESQHLISATYKKGLAFLNSNQTAQGVILLQQLIRKYPDSNEARMARENLRNLGLNP